MLDYPVCCRRILLDLLQSSQCCFYTPLLLSSLYWQKIILSPDSGPEEEELIDRTLPLETNNNLVSSTEKVYSPDPNLTDVTHSNGNASDCPIDSRVRDHTNNRIGESSFVWFFSLAFSIFQPWAHNVILRLLARCKVSKASNKHWGLISRTSDTQILVYLFMWICCFLILPFASVTCEPNRKMLFFLSFIPEDVNLQKRFEIQNLSAGKWCCNT